MKKHSDHTQGSGDTVASLIGLGHQSARKSYYPELSAKLDELEEERTRYKKLNEELEQRVAERTSELVMLNEQLRQEISEREQIEQQLKLAKEAAEEANRNKDKYFAAASHDLLQPMNAARLLVSALRERALDRDDAHLVERVHLALENAEDLITDLLDISKLDQKAVKPDISEFNLQQLLNSMVGEFQPVAHSKGLQLKAVPSSLSVRSDSRLLMRIIRNLISNAIRYTQDGRVLIGCRRRGDVVSIQIWDTGDGIPVDQQEYIFKEFRQMARHKGKNRQGLGLGLAIVERISRMLEHPVLLRSVEGQGSVFSVQVPLAEQVAPLRPSVTYFVPTPDRLQGLTILVIDNEESILVSMDALLSQWGCQVITAASEEEARELCLDEEWVPDAILADFHLHDDQLGTDAVQSLRKTFGSDIPAVILTADRSSECRHLFSQLSLPVLNKPVKPGKLRALLTHLLED
ncbi:ATP-binding response regulator [Oceanospirillum beijerinckii]|uniref:ATP-binding response regulator n=1 Tax=Oceanospirillum beijerinckii TaxID=64976 RepID=UPI000424FF80|nr:hybrid sensor histidine kinase/response regulator [Oceanospirillum beijerinckii]